jgi:hypothetical protein
LLANGGEVGRMFPRERAVSCRETAGKGLRNGGVLRRASGGVSWIRDGGRVRH